MTSTTRELMSIGYLAGIMQRSPQQLLARLKALNVEPELLVNGVPHYEASALEALRSSQREGKAKQRRESQQ